MSVSRRMLPPFSTLDRYVTAEHSWGDQYLPAGLAAWDAWVLDWERQPWTAEWASSDAARSSLQRLNRWFLDWLVDGRRTAAACFRQLAVLTECDRQRQALQQAAAAYARQIDVLEDLRQGLPGCAPEDGWPLQG